MLNTNNWKIFNLFDLFEEIKRGKRLVEEDRIDGSIPYFSASEFDNGLTDFIDNPLFIEKDSIIYTTFGDVFFVENEFTASDEISIFKSKFTNKYSALFIATILNFNKYKYAFGRKAFQKRLQFETLLLPIQRDENNIPIIDKTKKFHKEGYIPDWEYMQNYVKPIHEKIEEKNKTKNTNNKLSFDIQRWISYTIDDLFNIYTGGDLILNEIEEGKIPIVSHSENNCGVNYYTNIMKNRKIFNHNKCLSLADRGLFKTFTHQQDFYIGTRVKALELKNNLSNKYILLFISTIINNEVWRFNYGRNATDKLPKLIIKLPSKSNDDNKYEPDWEYMENYIKSLPYGDLI